MQRKHTGLEVRLNNLRDHPSQINVLLLDDWKRPLYEFPSVLDQREFVFPGEYTLYAPKTMSVYFECLAHLC